MCIFFVTAELKLNDLHSEIKFVFLNTIQNSKIQKNKSDKYSNLYTCQCRLVHQGNKSVHILNLLWWNINSRTKTMF